MGGECFVRVRVRMYVFLSFVDFCTRTTRLKTVLCCAFSFILSLDRSYYYCCCCTTTHSSHEKGTNNTPSRQRSAVLRAMLLCFLFLSNTQLCSPGAWSSIYLLCKSPVLFVFVFIFCGVRLLSSSCRRCFATCHIPVLLPYDTER